MDKIIDSLLDHLVDKDSYLEERNYYRYGLICMFLYTINICSIGIIAIYFNKLPECAVFLLAFIVLRSYGGGMHLKHWYTCYFLSCTVIVGMLFLPNYIYPDFIIKIIILTIGVTIYCIWAPVENINNPLSRDGKEKNRKKARIYGILIYICVLFARFAELDWVLDLLIEAVVLQVILMMIQKISIYVYRK